MIETGVFGEDDRVELLGGEIIQLSAIGPRHLWCVNDLNSLLVPAVGARGTVSIQNPMGLDDFSEPQPDVVLFRPGASRKSVPGPGDVLLAIEVSDSSLDYDRWKKVPRYGAAGIPESWVVNLVDRVVEVYRGPGPRGYESLQTLRPGDKPSIAALPDIATAVADLFKD
jgi:Uma2 family endonuclease